MSHQTISPPKSATKSAIVISGHRANVNHLGVTGPTIEEYKSLFILIFKDIKLMYYMVNNYATLLHQTNDDINKVFFLFLFFFYFIKSSSGFPLFFPTKYI